MTDVWIAKVPITHNGVLAHNTGDEVPDYAVKAQGWQDFVVRPGTKTAVAVTQPDPTP